MTNESTSLLSLGDLTKPATVLIEKISNAVGKIYEPIHIVKAAKSQATARIIEAESNIQIQELQQRALQRFLTEETRKQSNIESITTKALESLKEDAHPEDIENDWIVNFFDKCKLVSDEEMQQLWARILTNEANEPGTFSKRTIDALHSIDKTDADLFTKFCLYCWYFKNMEDVRYYPLIYAYDHNVYERQKINFDTLRHLDEIGLITFQGFGADFYRLDIPEVIEGCYFGSTINIKITEKSNQSLMLGSAIFSKTGYELRKICNSQANTDFFDYVIKYWMQNGYIVYSDYPKNSNQF